MNYTDFVVQFWPRFLTGTGVTLAQFVLAAILGIGISISMGLLKLSKNTALKAIAVTYIEVFRGTSLLVQLYWIFFVLPLFGLTIDKFSAGFIAVGMNIGAYGAELVRGGILSVPKGQWEAALAINMTPYQRMKRIILPQAVINILPPWGNLMIELLKGTALVSLISVTDLMFEARQINGTTFLSAQVFGTALIIYYVLARFLVTPSMQRLETAAARKLGRT